MRDGDGVVFGVDVEGVVASREVETGRNLRLGGVPLDVPAGLGFIGCAFGPVEVPGFDFERNRQHLLDYLVVDDRHEEHEVGVIRDSRVGQEQAVDVGGAVGHGVAEGRESRMYVVPGRVPQDGGVAVALFPDVAFEALLPL